VNLRVLACERAAVKKKRQKRSKVFFSGRCEEDSQIRRSPDLQGFATDSSGWEAVSTSNHFQNHFLVTSAAVTRRGDQSRLLIGARGK
jgi:hypothetical protein